MSPAPTAREAELQAAPPATLRAVAWRLGKPFPKPTTAAARREVIAWILAAEAAK